jgi:glycosyltransferase involved in cell wall biosynthesis
MAARRSIGIGDADLDAPVVLYLGALTEKKNVEQIIGAAARIPRSKLLIVGDGDSGVRAMLRQRASAFSVDTTFIPATDEPESILAAADLVALTSRTEGVPTVLLEAALAGLPVVATPVGGVPGIVQDGITGMLVPLDDVDATATAIVKAFQQRDELGAAARERVLALHAIDEVAASWENLFRILLARPASHP